MKLWLLNDRVPTQIIQYVSLHLVHSILLQDESLTLKNKSFFVIFADVIKKSFSPLKLLVWHS